MLCESRKHPNCTRDEGVVYDEDLDMELCPNCLELERTMVDLEAEEEDQEPDDEK